MAGAMAMAMATTIQLCNDDILAVAVRFTDIYNYQRFWAEIDYGSTDDYGYGFGAGIGSGCGYGDGNGGGPAPGPDGAGDG